MRGVGGGTILGKEHRACPQADQIQDLLCWVTLGNWLDCSDAHVLAGKVGGGDTANSLEGLGPPEDLPVGKEHQDPASHTDAGKSPQMMGCYELSQPACNLL